MNTIITHTARRVGAGLTAYLVAKFGIADETAQQIVVAGSVFLSLAVDGIAAALIARWK